MANKKTHIERKRQKMLTKKILITGGAGYIGSMLTTTLVQLGYRVTVLDVLKYSKNSLDHLHFYKNFKLITKDCRNISILKKLIKVNNIIIPLAALVGAPLCEKKKREAMQTNFDSIKLLIKILPKNKKIIFLTTNSGYGVGEKNKFCTEKTPLKPISLYGKTKSMAENEILKHNNSVCFRLATVFGYSFRMRTDLLVNNFVYNAIKKKKLKIFEGHFRRNFIHVKDVVRAIIFTINNFNKLKSNVYNLGLSSANITKIILANKIKKIFKDLKIEIVRNKKDPDQRDYFVSNKKIEKKGFRAKISIEDGLKELIKVLNNNSNKIKNNY
jgi:nucleoside-diphosphate-sugar epimerase